MANQRMVQTATLLHAKAERLLGIGFDFRQSEISGVVAMARLTISSAILLMSSNAD